MASEFTDVFERLIALTEQAANGDFGVVAQAPDSEPVVASGSDPDGLVTVTFSNGSVASVRVDPILTSLTPVEVEQAITAAMNAAIQANVTATVEAYQQNPTDFHSLAGNIRQLQQDADAAMRRQTEDLAAMLIRGRSL